MPPALVCAILTICSVTMSVTSFGATRWSSVVVSPMRFSIGKKLAIESRASSAGKRAKKK